MNGPFLFGIILFQVWFLIVLADGLNSDNPPWVNPAGDPVEVFDDDSAFDPLP